MKSKSKDRNSAILSNLLVLAALVCAYVFYHYFLDAFFRIVQEDQYLEWATFWAFFLAGVLYLRSVFNTGSSFSLQRCWFVIGLSLFSFFVAFEEISWGQRLLGINPPEYFLARNYQQEINLHNIISNIARRWLMYLIIVGYGVVLPLLMTKKALNVIFSRYGVVAPPLRLIPAFAVTGAFFFVNPFKFSAEWVELMLGLCFLFSALMLAVSSGGVSSLRPPQIKPLQVLGSFLLVLILGGTTVPLARALVDDDAAKITVAGVELNALKKDFESGRVRAGCGQHSRLYSLKSKRLQKGFDEGEFAALVERGMPEQRAEFLLDPWHYAYWIRVICGSKDSRISFVYSFGPNMRRDAMGSEDVGDDILVYIDD